MIEDEQYADDEVTIDQLTDFAFGMFTIYAEQSFSNEGKHLFAEIEKDDIIPRMEKLVESFSISYELLAEPLAIFGSVPEILNFYRNGEGILPSRTTHTYWIQQTKPGSAIESCGSEKAGKWLIFLPSGEVDDTWIKIRDATISGELGIGAKVSTSRKNEESRDDKKVIYVFTENWEDEADVMRVRNVLKELGIVDRIGYKRNIDTYAGEYREKGKRVTFYSI